MGSNFLFIFFLYFKFFLFFSDVKIFKKIFNTLNPEINKPKNKNILFNLFLKLNPKAKYVDVIKLKKIIDMNNQKNIFISN